MDKFEDYLNELQEIVKQLESGNLSLEESIEKYKRGLEIADICKKKLEEAKELIITKA